MPPSTRRTKADPTTTTYTPAERCVGCHNEREKLERAADVRLVHDVHVTRTSIDCVRCHNTISHSLLPQAASAAMPR